MLKYTKYLPHKHVYSIGDIHGRATELLSVMAKFQILPQELSTNACFVQLGDLIDCFSFPKNANVVNLRIAVGELLKKPEFADINIDAPMLAPADSHDFERSIAELLDPRSTIERDELYNELLHLHSALRSYETLILFKELQEQHPNQFVVVIGNHDIDLLRGRCRYAKRQKEFLLSFLGFSNAIAKTHIQEGCPFILEQSPILAWLNERPHIALSDDTVYMHGGPDAKLAQEIKLRGEDAFIEFLHVIDEARESAWMHPVFLEHDSFMSPDGEKNDWYHHPEILTAFKQASGKEYLAFGHSPFLHFPKGVDLDLNDDELQEYFVKCDRIGPGKILIKHDTNLKRGGRFCVCYHEVGTNIWRFLTP
ncbi:MAG: hypothetical protein WC966_00835 [Bradymonadales bacterium]|jgi:hypothetical protein